MESDQQDLGQDDRQVLAAPPDQDIALDQALLETLRGFIYGVFAHFREITVRVGRILSAQEARRYVRQHQVE